MKFGLFYLPTYLPDERAVPAQFDNIVEQVVFADKIGIDYVWMVEHHFVRHGGICAGNWAFLSYLAARTERIRLGTGATVLPLNDPVRVAELGATLDQLSKGRFDLGVGRGFMRVEFDTFGINMRETTERVQEGVDLIKRAWSGEELNYASKFRPPIENIRILPPIYQKPSPPIWNACFLTKESFEWTAEQGYNLLYVAYHVDPAQAKEKIAWYLDALKASGRAVEEHEVCTCYHAFFQEKHDIAKLRAVVERPMLQYTTAGGEGSAKPPDPVAYKNYTAREDYIKQSGFDVFFPGRVLMGGPDQVLDRIKTMRDMGITQVALIVDYGALPQAEIMRSMKIFAEEILPRAKEI